MTQQREIELDVDVTEAVAIGEQAHTRVTITFPAAADLADPPVVAFAWPGGGYNRRYYNFDASGPPAGGEAGWHARRGWIFVSCDHVGVGDSSRHRPDRLLFENMAAANWATARSVLERLADGSLGLAPVRKPVTIGLGQSRGGCLLIVQQAHHQTFDGIAVLGYSGIHTSPKSRPGEPRVAQPWIVRSSLQLAPIVLNAVQVAADEAAWMRHGPSQDVHPYAWCFHYDDVDRELVRRDMHDFMRRGGDLPEWGDDFAPAMSRAMLTPGVVASEAAAIRAPVLAAFGERDVASDPWLEPTAYRTSVDVTTYVCPRMGHMHNFASTRELLWARIDQWARGVAERRVT
jgi:pimeloyl-ACP methyl ester carboxylesterase